MNASDDATGQRQYYAEGEAAMLSLGAELSQLFKAGQLVFLSGDLGAGKTTLVRGLLQSLGVEGAVRSPTFTLIEYYELAHMTVCHLDLYRLEDREELEQLGIRDLFRRDVLLLVEWAERIADFWPIPDYRVNISLHNEGRRIVIDK